MVLALDHVAVWLDEMAAEGGAFAHALDWAAQLRLPLKALAPASEGSVSAALSRRGSGLPDGPPVPGRTGPGAPPAKLLACEAACLQKGVPWGTLRWQGPVRAGVDRFLCPVALCAFSNTLAWAARHEILSRSLHGPGAPLLICPPTRQAVSRVLVVNEPHGPGSCFLDLAAQVCCAFAVAPVILTVGRSERQVRLGQQLAEERLARQRLPADFDCVVGCDAAEAVAGVARWRRCSHVFVERPRAASWWGWLRGDLSERLLRLLGSLTILALPGAGRAAAVSKRACPAPAPRLALELG